MRALNRVFPVKKCMILLGLGLAFGTQTVFALSHSRAYSWGMEKGNLVSNWSFENQWQFWSTASAPPGFIVDARLKALGVVTEGAKNGSFVASISGSCPSNALCARLKSEKFPINPSQTYTLSFFYQGSSVVGTNRPVVTFYSDANSSISSHNGANYSAPGAWSLYATSFTTPQNAQYAMLTFAESYAQGHGGTFYFDNVILEEGSHSAASRDRISESVLFGDAFGRTHQNQLRLVANKYLVSASAFDEFARPETTFLASPGNFSQLTYQPNFKSAANNFYNGTSGKPAAGGFAFAEVQYSHEPEDRVVASSAPGATWKLSGDRTVKRGFYFSSALHNSFPSIENPPVDTNHRDLRVDWVRDADSNFTLTWTNRQGQVIQQASNITRGGTSAATWKFSTTRYTYFADGRPNSSRTPIDIQENSANFAEYTKSNTLGHTLSQYTKDAGLTRYWYNRRGNLRFSQDAGQRALNQFTYTDYDTQGRVISRGIQTITTMTQAIADQDIHTGGTKVERVGYIYDDFSTFQQRTGFPLDQIMPYHYFMGGKNGKGRLVCSYNRNVDGSYPGFTEKDKFVADFYDYDVRGNVTVSLKAVHPIRDPKKKFQDTYFQYDETDRLVETYNYVDASSSTLASRHKYFYDVLGRVEKVVGLNDKPLARFIYNDWGPLNHVILGGDGGTTKGTRIDYTYAIRGWVKEIKATDLSTGKITFQQFLGYETKSNPDGKVPDPIRARFRGQVTQQLYKFGTDVNSLNPVRLVNYNYDELGRMVTADYRKNSNSTPLNSNGTINFTALTWNNSQDQDSHFNYDLNGRITGQRTGGVSSADSARYNYQSASYRLSHVTGKLSPSLNRNMSAAGTFQYDERGSLAWDASKQLDIYYGWDKLPTLFIAHPSGSAVYQDQFYDAAGDRVSRFIDAGSSVQATHYLNLGVATSKEWRETLNSSGGVASSSQTVGLYGRAQIGRIRPDGVYEFYLKNHLGSTMRTAGDMGADPVNGGVTYDYLAYGDLRRVKETGSTVTEKFTGKEYEDLSRLYYFGARFFDPELGIWLTPDAANQYFNPYSYTGGNPVMYVDADGNFAFLVPLAIIAIGGAINLASNYDKVDNFWEGVGYFAIGAGQSAASVYLGPVGGILAGGLAGGLNTGLGGGNMGQIIQGGISGTIGSAAGLGASKLMGPALSKIDFQIRGVSSPFTQALGRGALGGAAGGFAGGFATGFIMSGGDVNAGLDAGLSGLKTGAVTGAITSAGVQTATSMSQGRNPFIKDPFGSPNGRISKPSGVPDNWVPRLSDNGKGVIWVDPNNPHNSIRVMQGDPLSPYENSRKPYVRHLRDGQYLDESGNQVPKKSSDSHIPLSIWEWPRN